MSRMHWTVHITGGPRRVNHAVAVVNSIVYSLGGYCTGDNYSVLRPIDIHVLNPVTFRWNKLPFKSDENTPFQRYGHTAVAYGRYIFLYGGRNDETPDKILYRFDTKTNSWDRPEVTGSIPGARDGHSATVIRDKMIVFGGYEEEIGLFSQDVYALDLKTFVWSFIPCCGQAPSFRDFHTATVYLDRYMFIFGGRGDIHGPFHTRSDFYCNTLVCLDIEKREWYRPKTCGPKPDGRRSHSSFMHNGYMYLFGGYNGITDRHFSDFYRYNPYTYEWSKIEPSGTGPAPRRRQGCVVLENKVYFFGGTSPSLNEASESDDDMNEESSLIDHDDMFVLDLEPSLKTICMLKVINSGLDYTSLPRDLKQEICFMTMPNKISPPLSSG